MVKNRVALCHYHYHPKTFSFSISIKTRPSLSLTYQIIIKQTNTQMSFANKEFIHGGDFALEEVEQQQEQVVEEEQDRFGQLPDELLLFIFNKILDAKSLVRCVSVSKRFASIVPQIDSVVLRLPRHVPIRKGYSKSLRPLKLFKFLANKFVSKPLRLLHHFVSTKSRSKARTLLYYSPGEVLKDFKEIKSLRLELPGHGGELGLNSGSDLSLLKWNAQFGSKLKSCTILGANSLEKKPNSQIDKQSKENEETGEILSLLADEELKLRIVWMVSSLIASSARHHLLKQVVAGFPTLSDVVITDGNKQGKLSMAEEQLAELRSSLHSSMESESSLERSVIPDLNMKLWYAPVLELPGSGFVMKGATLISIKPLDAENKGSGHGDLLGVAGFDDDGDEERKGLFGEAVRELVKIKKTYAMEMTSF